jgi:hypothetical protein
VGEVAVKAWLLIIAVPSMNVAFDAGNNFDKRDRSSLFGRRFIGESCKMKLELYMPVTGKCCNLQ